MSINQNTSCDKRRTRKYVFPK